MNWHNIAIVFTILISFGIIAKTYSNLRLVEQQLPNYGFLSIRDMHAQLRDLRHLKDMILVSKAAPASAESRTLLSEATDLAYVRFARVDHSRVASELPGYSQVHQIILNLIGKIETLLKDPQPFDLRYLSILQKALNKTETELNELYVQSGEHNKIRLMDAQHNLYLLKIEIIAILVILSTLLISVAVLLAQKQRAAGRLRHLAWHDAVTGLKNRAWLMEKGPKFVGAARARKRLLGLYIIDLDHFKNVNDSYGHHVGDALLREVADVLSTHCDDKIAFAFRLGGDEFAFLKQANSLSELTEFGDILCRDISGFRDIEGHQVRLGASVGYSICPDHGWEISALLKLADMALYKAKAGGRQNATIYSSEMKQDHDLQLQIEEDLKKAVRNEEFFLVWQPQLAVATGGLIGAEALLRWNNLRVGEIVQPLDFIPIAEKSDFILEVDRLVLRKVCEQASKWKGHIPDSFTLGVNISTRSLNDPDFPGFLQELLRTTGVPAHLLELELTERLFLGDRKSAHDILSKIRSLGVRIALDDFGTGYTSLASIADLDIHRIKIDQAFIANVCESRRKRSVIQSILTMCDEIGIETVAVGIETAEQFDFLIANGCTHAQGFFLAEPLSETVFSNYFGAHRTAQSHTEMAQAS